MKKMRCLIFIIAALLLAPCAVFSQSTRNDATTAAVPFSKGVNFSFWFDGGSGPRGAQAIQFSRYNEQEFANVKRLGVDVIRLPIDLGFFTSGAPGYTLDPFFFRLLDMAVDWAEKYQIYIILVNMPEPPAPTNNNYRNFLIQVWTQMAEHYKNRSEYVIYEILNEPNGISTRDWGRMQGEAIDAIRRIDQNHWIVVSGTDYSSIETLSSLPRYSDNKLLYTFHFYEPYAFTFQGDPSGGSTIEKFAGLPFPYDRSRMPVMPAELRETGLIRNYPNDATTAALTRKIDQAANFARQRNVPVFCGEFGVMKLFAPPEDRVRYIQSVRETLEARNIPWSMFCYFDHFGIYNSQIDGLGFLQWNSWGDFNTDLDVELVRALGLTPVPQRQRQKEPLRSGFTIYDDSFGRGLSFQNNRREGGGGQQKVNLYYTPPAEGEYAIHLGNIGDSDDFSIMLKSDFNDLSYLVQNGYVFEFKAKTETPASFVILFYNYKDNITWAYVQGIDQRLLPPDGRWHTIRMPLRDFQLLGGTDIVTRQSLEPRGNISWDNIFMLQINATNGTRDIYLDDIKITR
jgi:endoglucanase